MPEVPASATLWVVVFDAHAVPDTMNCVLSVDGAYWLGPMYSNVSVYDWPGVKWLAMSLAV